MRCLPEEAPHVDGSGLFPLIVEGNILDASARLAFTGSNLLLAIASNSALKYGTFASSCVQSPFPIPLMQATDLRWELAAGI